MDVQWVDQLVVTKVVQLADHLVFLLAAQWVDSKVERRAVQ